MPLIVAFFFYFKYKLFKFPCLRHFLNHDLITPTRIHTAQLTERKIPVILWYCVPGCCNSISLLRIPGFVNSHSLIFVRLVTQQNLCKGSNCRHTWHIQTHPTHFQGWHHEGGGGWHHDGQREQSPPRGFKKREQLDNLVDFHVWELLFWPP